MRPTRTTSIGAVVLAVLLSMTGLATAQEPEASEPPGEPGDLPPYAAITGRMWPVMATSAAVVTTDPTTGRQMSTDAGWTMRFETDDPRLDGEYPTTHDYYLFDGDDDHSGSLRSGIGRLSNEGGSWSIEASGFSKPGESSFSQNHYALYLTGEGGYDGLSAMLLAVPAGSYWAIDGVIAPGPLPEPPASEDVVVADADPELDASSMATIGEPADSGARIIAVEELDERMLDLTVDSPAVGTEKVRLLLPPGFDPQADADWPVLYLLHGALDDYTSWTRETDVAELVADLDLLVAMPEAGELGWYSDWWNGGEGGPPMWETFHLTEVRELLERNWQAGDDRVVAGVSMGGLGAMSYAARHPELFKAAASFSGALHPMTLPLEPPRDVWGDRIEQVEVWEAHDPILLAEALEGTPLYVSYGNGELGPLDADGPATDDSERWITGMNDAFVTRLEELGIPAEVDAYGPGTHTWPYFERSLHGAMPMLMEALEN